MKTTAIAMFGLPNHTYNLTAYHEFLHHHTLPCTGFGLVDEISNTFTNDTVMVGGSAPVCPVEPVFNGTIGAWNMHKSTSLDAHLGDIAYRNLAMIRPPPDLRTLIGDEFAAGFLTECIAEHDDNHLVLMSCMQVPESNGHSTEVLLKCANDVANFFRTLHHKDPNFTALLLVKPTVCTPDMPVATVLAYGTPVGDSLVSTIRQALGDNRHTAVRDVCFYAGPEYRRHFDVSDTAPLATLWAGKQCIRFDEFSLRVATQQTHDHRINAALLAMRVSETRQPTGMVEALQHTTIEVVDDEPAPSMILPPAHTYSTEPLAEKLSCQRRMFKALENSIGMLRGDLIRLCEASILKADMVIAARDLIATSQLHDESGAYAVLVAQHKQVSERLEQLRLELAQNDSKFAALELQ
jgi:hypothetical protein